uniref:C-type mannose receptor 2-like n=1 Tax=Sinocyclocheilus rhinocerous TaxID=307959 RepID=A0A673M6B1_9TELE
KNRFGHMTLRSFGLMVGKIIKNLCKCLDHMLYLSSSCKGDAQLWKWVTRGRLFNIGSSLCLGITTGNVSTSGNKSPLGVFRCDYEPPRVRWTWSCSKFLETLESSLPSPKLLLDTGHCMYLSLSVFPGGNHEFLLEVRQLVFLCLFFSIEIYTIQGNSHGSPCYFPFLYDGQWFHSCTSVGREDGFHWCATTHDYGKDQRWGFCPVLTVRPANSRERTCSASLK